MIPRAILLASALGTVAVLADAVPGPVGRALLLVASTGLAWGVGAAIVGARAPNPWVAALSGAIVMVGAVVVYYGGIAVLGLRPSSDWRSLRSAATVWGAVGAIAGPVLGALGWHAARARGATRSVLWGILAGALLSQSIYLMPRDLDGARELFGPDLTTLALLLLFGITAPTALVVIGSRRRHLLLGLGVMVLVGIIGAAVWAYVQNIV